MKILTALIAALIAITALSADTRALNENELSVSAASAVVINCDTGEMLFGKNAFDKRAMASTTKIMTALLTLEAGELDKQFTVDSMAIRVEGTSMGLKEGDIVTRRALCVGMLLPSGNDAANAAAVSISGNTQSFAELMNKRAKQIGMNDTHFVTPSGLDADGHYTTAYDMALLACEALKNDDFRAICGLSSADVRFGNPPYLRTLYNSNKMLKLYDGCIGMKTGFTDNARRCLVSAAEKDGCTIAAVTLNAPDDWDDHKKLLDYGFSKIRSYDIDVYPFAVDVIGGETEAITAIPKGKTTLGLTEEQSREITVKYYLPKFVYAGISDGEIIGRAEIYCGGKFTAETKLVAAEGCPAAKKKNGIIEEIADFFSNLFSKE